MNLEALRRILAWEEAEEEEEEAAAEQAEEAVAPCRAADLDKVRVALARVWDHRWAVAIMVSQTLSYARIDLLFIYSFNVIAAFD